MHFPLIKALLAVISAAVLAIGVALAPAKQRPHHLHSSSPASQTSSLQTDGLQFLAQLAAGDVKPDAALKYTWTDDVTAVAHSLGLSDSALAAQLSAGRSLAQIAASRGVPASTPTSVLLRRVRGDLSQAEHDRALSPTAAGTVLNALGIALGNH